MKLDTSTVLLLIGGVGIVAIFVKKFFFKPEEGMKEYSFTNQPEPPASADQKK
jgi:hypothetical protein